MRFIGRQNELAILERLKLKKTSSLAVVWGRRRIGKSTLVNEFIKEKTAWTFSGLSPHKNKTHQEELDFFIEQMARNIGMPKLKTDSWSEVFWHLGSQASKLENLVIFMDEISWMGSKDPNFLGYLKAEWDSTLSKCSNLILILCGSVSTWIEDNIINSTGFYGRISIKLKLEELPLPDCNEFWNAQKDRVSAYEKLKILSVTGGIPKYLEEIIPSESAEKNLSNLCFRKEGLLYREYQQIFYDLFSNRMETFDRIIRTLKDGSKNLDEICSSLNIQKSGNITRYLDELISSGFVAEDSTWNIKTKKESTLKRFRLRDNYIRFFLKFIEPNEMKIEQGGFIIDSVNSFSGWEAIMGLQFENLVINNLSTLCQLIGIPLSEVERYGPFFQRKSKINRGCQIDLLIQAKFGTLYLCEIKFYKEKVGNKVIEEMRNKLERLSYPKGYSLRPVLVHVNGVTQEVIESELFDKIIDFSSFLNGHR